MARLTRTAKYAELREKLSQDREESLHTEDLSKYAEKLDVFTNDTNTVLKNEPVQEEKPQPVQDTAMKSLDDILASMMEENVAAKQETNESLFKTIDTETEMIDDLFANAPEPEEIPLPSFMQEEEEVVEPVQNEVSIDSFVEVPVNDAPVADDNVVSIDAIMKAHENDPVEEVKQEEVAPVQEEKNEPISNNFINDTLNEVNNYNKETGNKTLEQLSNSLIDSIRHPEEPVVDNVIDETVEEVQEEVAPVVEEVKAEPAQEEVIIPEAKTQEEMNEEFANTVSLEISKVLEEIKQQQDNTVKVALDEVKVAEQAAPAMEHPVKAIAKEEEEPVVIKNISETIKTQKVDDVLDDTIPFNVNAVKPQVEDDDDEYEEDEEAPSKVLNVILAILIFVLVAVLGVIVYYILVAKGIIG